MSEHKNESLTVPSWSENGSILLQITLGQEKNSCVLKSPETQGKTSTRVDPSLSISLKDWNVSASFQNPGLGPEDSLKS